MKRIREPLRTSTWNVTFADLMMLLLSFFVLKLALARPPSPPHSQWEAPLSLALPPSSEPNTSQLPKNEEVPASLSDDSLGDATAGFTVQLGNCFDDTNAIRFDCRTRLLTLSGVAKRKRLAVHVEVRATDWGLAADQTAVALGQMIDGGVAAESVTGMVFSQPQLAQGGSQQKKPASLSILTIALHTNR